MISTVLAFLMLFFHVLNDIAKLSFYSLTLIRFQERKRSIEYSVCCFLLVGLAIHVAFDITLLAIAETTIARLNIINNSLNSTS